MNKEKNLSQSLKDLDKIVDWFDEQEEVDIENGLKKVKAGVRLITEIKKQLKEVENEFVEVKKEFENE